MYRLKHKIYADAGKILKYKNGFAYSLGDIDLKDVSEIDVNIDDMHLDGQWIIYSNGLLRELNSKSASYGEWKAKFIGKQFSSDSQIAIMLNKDDSAEDALLYKKMQEWRAWSGKISNKIVKLNGNN